MLELDLKLGARREFIDDFNNDGLVDSRDPDNLEKSKPGGVGLTRHHIVPYTILRDCWNTVVDHHLTSGTARPKWLKNFFAVIKDLSSNLGLIQLDATVKSLNDFIEAVSDAQLVHVDGSKAAADYKYAKDAFCGILTWCPGNLIVGPKGTDNLKTMGRVDDPKDHYEKHLIEHVVNQQNQYALMNMRATSLNQRSWTAGCVEEQEFITRYGALFNSKQARAQKIESRVWEIIGENHFVWGAKEVAKATKVSPWSPNTSKQKIWQVAGRHEAMVLDYGPPPKAKLAARPATRVDTIISIDIGGRQRILEPLNTWTDGSGCYEFGLWVDNIRVEDVLKWASQEWKTTVDPPEVVRNLTISGVSVRTVRGPGWLSWQAQFSAETTVGGVAVLAVPRVEWVQGGVVAFGATLAIRSAAGQGEPVFYFDGEFGHQGTEWTFAAKFEVTAPIGVKDIAEALGLSIADVPHELIALLPALTGAQLSWSRNAAAGDSLAVAVSTEHVRCVVATVHDGTA